MRSVEDGERIVLTRHGSPKAAVLSLRDAMELLIERELPALETAAERDFAAGKAEALDPPGPYVVLLARAAVDTYGRMRTRDRRLLRDALVCGEADEERLLWLSSGRWFVAFSYVDQGTVVVHQAFEVRELERELVGEAIWEWRRRIEMDRGLHGRAPWQLAGEPDGGG